MNSSSRRQSLYQLITEPHGQKSHVEKSKDDLEDADKESHGNGYLDSFSWLYFRLLIATADLGHICFCTVETEVHCLSGELLDYTSDH